MAAEIVRRFDDLEAQSALLLGVFKQAGYEPVAPAIIQPADIFLDEIGESVRSRSYLFTDPGGEELCLRPDLTLPVCRVYLERHPKADAAARYCYDGPAFRYQTGAPDANWPREFRQAGIECIGGDAPAACETEVITLAVEAVRRAGLNDFTLRFGDIALFVALIDALGLPERWRRRLRHYFWRIDAFHDLLRRLAQGKAPASPMAAETLAGTLDGLSLDAAMEAVMAHLDANALPLTGNRTLEEVTTRLLDQAADLRADALPNYAAAVIDEFLSVSGPPLEAATRITAIAKHAGIDLDWALDFYVRRFEGLIANGLSLERALFVAEFGRRFEYYTGLVFQIETGGAGEGGQLAGGGRYDALLGNMGAPRPTPAVGCAIHTERLLAALHGIPL